MCDTELDSVKRNFVIPEYEHDDGNEYDMITSRYKLRIGKTRDMSYNRIESNASTKKSKKKKQETAFPIDIIQHRI